MIVHDGGYPIEVPLHSSIPVEFPELDVQTARSIYGQFWRLVTLTHPQFVDEFCYCCGQPADGRASANVWGSVIDFPSCGSCRIRFDRKLIEGLPCAWGK